MFVKGAKNNPDFVGELPVTAERILKSKRLTKSERRIAQWMLGLTDKASQNVLRDNAGLLTEYRRRYTQVCEQVINESISN